MRTHNALQRVRGRDGGRPLAWVSSLVLIITIILSLFATVTSSQRPYDEYERNSRQSSSTSSRSLSPSYESSYFDLNRTNSDYQQRQVPARPVSARFDWSQEARTPRYEWSRQYYQSTTTTTERPWYRESSPDTNYQHSVSVARGTSSSDGKQMPGPLVWYNNSQHWSNNRPRGYDIDLDGPTQPPPQEETRDEEPWPLQDLKNPTKIDDRHPLAIYSTGRCDDFNACYPATGNLLIGREKQLKASSTCGLRNPIRYCVVSHLKEKKKCFYCDSREQFKGTSRYHGIENVVTRIGTKRNQFWWQAENGVEGVSVQFDLEAEFHFTHLVITFKTFRPAAMLIERSHNFGQTWQVYQYFAYNCASSFPSVRTGPRLKITDVVCDSQYSFVEPSTEGEVIFRVLPPNIRVDDPYSKEVQDVLKITNLRINMTQLHNLGDNLLDPRSEIKEKYYYSIYDMVVRGSCSCYGHASRCIPDNSETVPDMVYGRCECTHHTKGRNCELCEDLYNDQEWKPAFGRDTNPCKLCNCNNHASRCHFDHAVFIASGNVSGGVCDDCQHNTMGAHCEMCKLYYFRDAQRSADDPYVCQQCDCDPLGSEDEGLCDQATGKCTCKLNIEGKRCDHCKPGFWNMSHTNVDGCQPCSCNKLGTVGNLGCNVMTGECVCKRNVVGRDCNECEINYYGLSEDEEGCKFCDCDPGGAYSQSCDQQTGQCRCRPHVTGRRCDQPEEGYFVPALDHMTIEAEGQRLLAGSPGEIVLRQPYVDRPPSWSGTGFMRVPARRTLEVVVDNLPESKLYDIVVRYEPESEAPTWNNVRLTLQRVMGPIDPSGPCHNYSYNPRDIQMLEFNVQRQAAAESICLEKNTPYKVLIDVPDAPATARPEASVLIDSIAIVPRHEDIPFFAGNPENDRRKLEFERFRCASNYHSLNRPPEPNEYCRKLLMSVGFYVFDGAHACNCNSTGSSSQMCAKLGGHCPCRANVAERVCSRCHVGYYGFGPDGCRPCDCNGFGSLDAFCEETSGQCNCRTGTYGRQCDECQAGYWNYPNCERCACNGFSDLCDSKTGTCIDCRDNTAAAHCNECARGFYGDPLGTISSGRPVPCRECPCPGIQGSGMTHAETCQLDPQTENVVCHCKQGYTGERCDRCQENYFGDPTIPGGQCRKCECNNNIDIATPASCDKKTGECLKCLYDTAGTACELCKPGFFGDALKQSCARCVCNILGTDQRSAFCNQTTGQCSCLPNVEGQSCDRCAENHWNLASSKGCEACDCDPQGSDSMKCNEIDGQCRCKPTFGGRRCDECLPNHWGDPRVQCQLCDCNLAGSQSVQCDKTNGSCVCIAGISGPRCDRCARGFTGQAPNCEACGECFNNWDMIIQRLRNQTLGLLDKARAIKQMGTTGAYTKQFTQIEVNLNEIDNILKGQDMNERDLTQVQHMIEDIKDELNSLQDTLNAHEKTLHDTKANVIETDSKLNNLLKQSENLKLESERLKENATTLQEANVEGAYQIIKDAQRRSKGAEQQIKDSFNILAESENKRRFTEQYIDQAKSSYNLTFQENESALNAVANEVAKMEAGLPNINHLVCDEFSTIDNCNTLCGGAGCGRCGGLSCTKGATTRASKAVDMARDADGQLKNKEREVKDELRRIMEARAKSEEALAEAKAAFDRVMAARNASTGTAESINELLRQINDFLVDEGAKPEQIRTLAEKCKELKMSLEPKQIENLATEINKTIAGLRDIDKILAETRDSLRLANDLKIKADQAKERAQGILRNAQMVMEALEEARKAQEKARQSIDKANGEINNIGTNLRDIDGIIGRAQTNVNDTNTQIRQLNGRFEQVRKKFANNKYLIDMAKKEAEEATKYANNANKDADDLEKKFREADEKMKQKNSISNKLRGRAGQLKEAASELFSKISTKFAKIKEYEGTVAANEGTLSELQRRVDELNNQMKNHLEHIEARSKHYRDCQA